MNDRMQTQSSSAVGDTGEAAGDDVDAGFGVSLAVPRIY